MDAIDSQRELSGVIGDWGRQAAIPDAALRRAMRVAVEAFDANASSDPCEFARRFLRGFFAHPANGSRPLSATARRALAEPTERAA